MSFVKLDEKILHSTIWSKDPDRIVFIAALLRARPFFLGENTAQLEVDTLDETGWVVPAGAYGLVEAAGCGIIRLAAVDDREGNAALKRLGQPEGASSTDAFGGRRLVRIDGGYLVLNYEKYRQKDHTAAERMRRYRDGKRRKKRVARTVHGPDWEVGERPSGPVKPEPQADGFAAAQGRIMEQHARDGHVGGAFENAGALP